MSDQANRRRQQQNRRRRNQKKQKRGDLWRPVPQLEPAEPIAPAADPTALLRSLGDLPFQGQGAVAHNAERYVGAVVERAAGLATALAAAAGLLVESEQE